MKNLIKLSAALLVLTSFAACKKSGTKPSAPSIIGDWKLVSDSSYLANGTTISDGTDYKGTSSDIYDFKSGGGLTWHENNMGSDSASYVLKADTLTIAYLPKSNPNYSPDAVNTYKVTMLTSNQLVLNTYLITADGVSYDIMNFSR